MFERVGIRDNGNWADWIGAPGMSHVRGAPPGLQTQERSSAGTPTLRL
jgi:hypothetical protein